MAYGHKTEHRLRVRAQVVLHAARGRSHACTARETGLHVDIVRRCRGRFAQAGLPGLKMSGAVWGGTSSAQDAAFGGLGRYRGLRLGRAVASLRLVMV
ncbi:helix-turn-helix domain-containing protein [Streptomyces sp. NPDC021749]|uniref:helix-turn-helix domain-containing protein n=1 Tax=Streptomyces sp. NPDC021749 TaxID=3154905 RepID=UPI0033DF3A91